MKIAGYEVHPAAELFPMLGEAELESLTQSIRERGLLCPVVRADGKILDGRNRLLACERAGIAPTFTPHDGSDPWKAVWAWNAERRQIEDKIRLALIAKDMLCGSDAWESERAAAVVAANAARSAAAKEQISQQPRAPDGKVTPSPASHEARPGRDHRAEAERKTASRIASVAHTSRATVERAEELKRKAPALAAQVKAGELQGSKALGVAKLEAKKELAATLAKEPVPTPEGPFRVIAIDPPWQYGSRVEDTSHRGRNQYPDMSTEEICRLPVKSLAHDHCVLWLWTTNSFMHDAFHCLEAWGFTPKTILTWNKELLGLGDYLRNVTEHCILAVRGSPILIPGNATTLLSEPRREHSRKPEGFYRLAERVCSGASRLEMFAREPREGWVIWGGEPTKFSKG